MLEIFEEDNYNFTDSIIIDIKMDGSSFDYLIKVDYYLGYLSGEIQSEEFTLRLKNVKQFDYKFNYADTITHPSGWFTLAHIGKKRTNGMIEIVIESSVAFDPKFDNDPPMIYCLCEEAYIER